jgi:hypothetical protein
VLSGSIEKSALDWNPQGARRSGRPKKALKKMVKEEAMEVGTGAGGSATQMQCPQEEATGINY